jgi:hypothetical protein
MGVVGAVMVVATATVTVPVRAGKIAVRNATTANASRTNLAGCHCIPLSLFSHAEKGDFFASLTRFDEKQAALPKNNPINASRCATLGQVMLHWNQCVVRQTV